MSLNPQYIIMPPIQETILDKDTGLPLVGGKVYFYSDVNRADLKAIFELTGSPPNYTYTELTNPITLGAAGNFQDDSENDIIPYLYPYDINGNLELYYIVVKDSDGNIQFSRQAWPNLTSSGSNEAIDVKNYIPNGQFLEHYDVPLTDTSKLPGQITAAITPIAAGGFTFERPETSTATDFVTFERVGDYVSNPTGSPRFLLRIKNTVPSPNDDFKDARAKFLDVNKFASSEQLYTFAFEGQSNGDDFNVTLHLIKNFGTSTSGSPVPTPEQTTIIKQFTLTSSMQVFSVAFDFGTNEDFTIGSDNNDFVQLAISYPTNAAFDGSVVNWGLYPGSITVTQFPTTTAAEFIYESIPGSEEPSAADGSELYLPLINTPFGQKADKSWIGKYVYDVRVVNDPAINQLLADATQLEYAAYSDLGIPYSRLGDLYLGLSSTYGVPGVPIFGTGANYVTAYPCITPTTNIQMSTNKGGPVTNSADVNTGFTITTPHTGYSTDDGGYGFNKAFNYAATSILVIAAFNGQPSGNTAANAGTSGWTVADARNVPGCTYMFTVTVTGTPAAGTYFTFASGGVLYYMWFKLDGAGSDPMVGGHTGIEVDLLSTYALADITAIVREAILGYQVTNIVCTAASTISNGDYWTFNTANDGFYVWYDKGSGTDPIPSGRKPVKVTLTGTETAAQVVQKTYLAIDKKYYALPDARGMVLRGWDNGRNIDLDASMRLGVTSYAYGDHPGTYQWDQILNHTHSISITPPTLEEDEVTLPISLGIAGSDTGFVEDANTQVGQRTVGLTIVLGNPVGTIAYTGNDENRVVNFSSSIFVIY